MSLEAQLHDSIAILIENRKLRSENSFLAAQVKLLEAKIAKERKWTKIQPMPGGISKNSKSVNV